MKWTRHRKPPPGRHLRPDASPAVGRHQYPNFHENEIKAAIVTEARDRVTGHYSGVLTNGDSYEVDMAISEFDMDFTEFEFIIH